jgi:hypothetical protein
MRRRSGSSLALTLLTLPWLALAGGCAMCCAPHDCDYLYQGGAWVRTNPSSGRVGSAFDNAGMPVVATGAPATEPTPAPQPDEGSTPVPGSTSTISPELGETYLP